MPNLTELPARCEAADASEQRELLEAAWATLRPEPSDEWKSWPGERIDERRPDDVSSFSAWLDWHKDEGKFNTLLRAEAWLDAATMLVPEGWECALYWNMPGFKPEAQLENDRRRNLWLEPITGKAATPALALTAASLRALASKEQSDEGSAGSCVPWLAFAGHPQERW